jgi:acyl-CoA synthetase (AMP-forming)/AMP-acid ligase II
VWEAVADALPDAPATSHGGVRRSWRETDRRSDGVAAWLLSLGAPRQSTVAQYLYSCPEYVEALFACFKASFAPVNTNYRYTADELAYLWGNAGCVAVVFHGAFVERIEELRAKGQVDQVRGWLWVDDGSAPCPAWATPYEDAAAMAGEGRTVAPEGRSGDDLYLLYTGGTTGMPKGVMWRQDDLFASLNATAPVRHPEDGTLEDVRAALTKPGIVSVPCAPLMHGTGAFTIFATLSSGGCCATLTKRSFDPVELLDLIQAEKVKSLAIVGDAFAKPILAALDAEPDRWDISSLRVITSSGVMWSQQTKQGLLRHNPRLILVDSLGSSEAIGMAQSVSTADDGAAGTASFKLGPNTAVITEDGRHVEPGSGERGRVALKGRGPLGYYKDEAKTAATFQVVDGVRWSIPGDWAEVLEDGTLKLLGRGSVCINTGGEKVFPEEVEEALKTHPAVLDAVVVGVPDERFGEAVTAMVEPRAGQSVDEHEVIAHVREHLAAYKAPRRVLLVDTIGRAANGKVDYGRLKREAAERVGT